ncbi:cytochrome P450 [Russula compacta]|nr:cytochrome P450 [Russula compacta]
MVDESTVGVPFLTVIFILITLFITWYRGVDPLLDAIPTVGFSDPILSYLSAFRYSFVNGIPMLQQGYEKTKPGLFKIAGFRRWVVVPSGVEQIEDVRRAPDDVLSNMEPLREFIQAKFTIAFLNIDDTYHRSIIRSRLTRNVAPTFDQVHDELVGALSDSIPVVGEEWSKVSILPTVQRIICRTSSRVFVGAPLCRNPEYLRLASGTSVNIMNAALIIGLFPKALKPLVARMVSKIPSQVRQTIKFIGPLIEERYAKMEELGERWENPPSDMLMWLMSEAKGVERSVEGLVRRMLLVNFTSIHTTSLTFTQVLYRLLANPEYIEPLRKEVEAVVAEEGWTKAAMDKMHKIDSFVRETQRVDGLAVLAINRLVLRPFTFSNGVTIPPGTLVSLPMRAVHTDGEIYPHPEEFDGFRFEKLREGEGDVISSKHQTVTTSPDLLAFGIGRHACPGRYLAANEIKSLLAHILLSYDVKFEEGKGVPRQRLVGSFIFPENANILFRKRQV